jgi:hypothetical protein
MNERMENEEGYEIVKSSPPSARLRTLEPE